MPLWVVPIIIVGIVVLGFLAQRFGLIDLTGRQRTSGSSGVMGIGDEVFHPTRHEAQIELDRQTILPAPAPLPGDGAEDPGRGVYSGKVRIDL